jgi:hypothetical protein
MAIHSRPSRRLRGLTAVAAIAATATVMSVLAAPAARAGQPTAPADPGNVNGAAQAKTTADALDQARNSGKSVLDLSQVTESNATYANPDGTFTSVLSGGPVRLKQANGGWADIDTRLVSTSTGRYRAANSKSAVSLSAGRNDKALASSSIAGSDVAIDWPTTLPAAVANGAKLTYPDVAAGTDLEVAALPTGYEFSLVLKTRPAGPVTYTLPLDLPRGWTAREDASSGTVALVDGSGKVQGRVGGIHAYGNTRDPHTGDLGPVSDTATRLRTTASGPVVDVTPDPTFLQAPTTTYPVHVDPSVTMNDTYDTYVDRAFPNATYATQPDLHVGYYTPGGGLKRSFVNFDTSGIAGKIVTAATAKVFVTHVWNCATYTTEIWGANATISATTNWTNAPDPSGHYGNFTFANLGDTCSGGAHAPALADVTSMATAWAANGASRNTMTLKSPSDTDVNQYRKFDSVDAGATTAPIVVVTYNNPNTPPSQVSGRSVGGNVCTCSPAFTADNTPALTGAATDPDAGALLRYDYEIYNGYLATVDGSGNASATGLTPTRSGSTAATYLTGAPSSWAPATPLPDGKYSYRVRAYDGAAFGVWSSGWVQFTVDATGPVTAIASSTNPNETLWYSNNKPAWAWSASAASPIKGYSSALDQTSNTTPDTVSDGTGTAYTQATALADGVWYLHIRAQGTTNIWGAADHFKMNIDATNPSQPASVSSTTHVPNVPSNTKVIHAIWTAGSDATSGVAGYSYAFNTSQSAPADTVLDVSAATLSGDSPQLGDGTYWIHVRTIDQAGNASGDVAYGPIIIDTAGPTAPTLPDLACAPQDATHWYAQTSTTCAWTPTDGAVGWSYSFDANQNGDPGTTQNASTPTTGLKSGLPDGTTYLHVRGKDTAGNWGGIGTTALHIDSTPPASPTITANNAGGVFGDGTNPAGKYYSSTSPLLSWTATDTAPVDAYSYTFDRQATTDPGTLNTTTDTSYTPTGVADGTWYLHVRARNAAGLWSAPSHYAVRIDTTAPNAAVATSPTHPTNGAINVHEVKLDWSAQPGGDIANQYGNAGLAGYSYSFTSNAAATPDATVDTVTTSLTQTLADGTWYFNLATVDKAGNLSSTSYGPIRIDSNSPPVTDADRDRFVSLWKPRVLSDTFYEDWFANPIPQSILDEGFHGLADTQKHYLGDQLWAAVMSGHRDDPGLDPAGEQAMYDFVFDKDKAARPAQNGHYASSEMGDRSEGSGTPDGDPADLLALYANRAAQLVPSLTDVVRVPDVPASSIHTDLDSLPAIPQADVSSTLSAASQTVSDALDTAGSVVTYAQQQLSDADNALGYTPDGRAVFALPSRLPVGYTACWQSATSSGCKDALLLSTPVDVDVTGDGSNDVTVTFGPAAPNPITGGALSLTNLTLDVKRVAPPLVATPGTPSSDLDGKAIKAHVWIMYDIPNPSASGGAGAGTRLRLGADGFVRGEQLSEDTSISFNVTDPAALLTHDIKADIGIHHTWPSSARPQWALTAGFENTAGDPDPVTAALTFATATDFTGSLQDANDDSTSSNIDRTISLTAATPVPGFLNLAATGTIASVNETSGISAQMTNLPAATTFTFHRTYDDAAKKDTQDFAARNAAGSRIPRLVGAMTIARQGTTDRATFRLENTSTDFTVDGTATAAGSFDYTYKANDGLTSGPVDLSVRKTDNNGLAFAMRLASSGLPHDIHASYGKSATAGDDRTLLNLASSSGFDDVAFVGYDRSLQIGLSGKAAQLTAMLTGSISPGARHMDFTAATGSDPGIGLIDAVFSANGGTFSRSPGEHATVNLNGSAVGASIQLHGVRSVSVDRPDNNHVAGSLEIDNHGQPGRGATVGGVMQGLRFGGTIGALPDHATLSISLGSPSLIDLTTTPSIPSLTMFASLAGTGRLDTTMTGLPTHVHITGDLTSQRATLDYAANSRLTSLDRFMVTTDPTATDRSGTTLLGSGSSLPAGLHAVLARDLRSFDASATDANGQPDEVGSLTVQASRGGALADVPTGQHLTLTGTPSAYAISGRLDHLRSASASIAADLVHGSASVTLAQETGPFVIHYNVDAIRLLGYLSTLPKTMTINAATNQPAFTITSFSSIDKVIGYFANTSSGPTIGAQLEGTPTSATVNADLTNPVYGVDFTASGPTRRAAGYYSPDYLSQGLTASPTGEFVFADASGTRLSDGSYASVPSTFKATFDASSKLVQWRDSDPIGQITVAGTGALLGGLTLLGTARGVPGDFDASLGDSTKLFDAKGGSVEYLQLQASNHGILPGRLTGRHIKAVYDLGNGNLDASAELDHVSYAKLVTSSDSASIQGVTDSSNVKVRADVYGLVPDDSPSNRFLLHLDGTAAQLPSSISLSASPGRVVYDSSGHLNGQLNIEAGWTKALADTVAQPAAVASGISFVDAACSSGCSTQDGNGDRTLCSSAAGKCFAARATVTHQALPKHIGLDVDPSGAQPLIDVTGLAAGSLAVHGAISQVLPFPTALELKQDGIAEGGSLKISKVSFEKDPNGVHLTAHADTSGLNGQLKGWAQIFKSLTFGPTGKTVYTLTNPRLDLTLSSLPSTLDIDGVIGRSTDVQVHTSDPIGLVQADLSGSLTQKDDQGNTISPPQDSDSSCAAGLFCGTVKLTNVPAAMTKPIEIKATSFSYVDNDKLIRVPTISYAAPSAGVDLSVQIDRQLVVLADGDPNVYFTQVVDGEATAKIGSVVLSAAALAPSLTAAADANLKQVDIESADAPGGNLQATGSFMLKAHNVSVSLSGASVQKPKYTVDPLVLSVAVLGTFSMEARQLRLSLTNVQRVTLKIAQYNLAAGIEGTYGTFKLSTRGQHFTASNFAIQPGISLNPLLPWDVDLFLPVPPFPAGISTGNFYGEVIQADETGQVGPCLGGWLEGSALSYRMFMRPWPTPDPTPNKNVIVVDGSKGRQIFTFNPMGIQKIVGELFGVAMATVYNPYNNFQLGLDVGGPFGC